MNVDNMLDSLRNAKGEGAGGVIRSVIGEIKCSDGDSAWTQDAADKVGVAIIRAAEVYKEAVLAPLNMKLEDAVYAQKTYKAQHDSAIRDRDSHVKYREVVVQEAKCDRDGGQNKSIAWYEIKRKVY